MADQKVIDLTADTSPTIDDLLYLVNDPGGTPGDRKVTAESLRNFILASSYIQVRDEQTQNTAGGTFTQGSWQTRVLNTEVTDVGGYCSLASNQITLTAGTYRIYASAPAFSVNRHQLRLQNVTDATTVLIGTSSHAPTSGAMESGPAEIRGIFTIGASKALELQHQCQATKATNGLGVEANFTTEVYAVVELWKIG